MNPIALIGNISQSLRVCPTWEDRLERIKWLYSDKPFMKPWITGTHQIKFNYLPPINEIEVIVRDNQGSDNFIFGEVFDHQYYNLDLPFTPHTILDLGANAGFTTIFFSLKYPNAEIACVEPIPENIDVLTKNLDLNQVDAKLFASAISIEDGSIQMEIAPLDYGHKVADIEYGEKFNGKTLDVRAISVKTLMQQMRWERIGLLKIDIEGYEAILLAENCDWLSQVDALCIECHEGYGESDLFSLAEEWGFNMPQKLPGTWLLVRN